MLATAIFAKDVGDAIVENVLKSIDLIYIWQGIVIIIVYFTLNKSNYFNTSVNINNIYAIKCMGKTI